MRDDIRPQGFPWGFRKSYQVPGRVLKRFLLIFRERIFDSRVDRGMPNLAAAPFGPYTRPSHSFKVASIISFCCARSLSESTAGGSDSMAQATKSPESP